MHLYAHLASITQTRPPTHLHKIQANATRPKIHASRVDNNTRLRSRKERDVKCGYCGADAGDISIGFRWFAVGVGGDHSHPRGRLSLRQCASRYHTPHAMSIALLRDGGSTATQSTHPPMRRMPCPSTPRATPAASNRLPPKTRPRARARPAKLRHRRGGLCFVFSLLLATHNGWFVDIPSLVARGNITQVLKRAISPQTCKQSCIHLQRARLPRYEHMRTDRIGFVLASARMRCSTLVDAKGALCNLGLINLPPWHRL